METPKYRDKYIKYKTKYLELNNFEGGAKITKNTLNNIIKKNPNNIYPIHSISKLFTNILTVLLYDDNIINDEELNKPIF